MKSIKQIVISAIFCFLFINTLMAQDNPNAILGNWKTGSGNAVIQIYKNGEKFQGKIISLQEPNDPETGKPRLDKQHPDPANRTRPILGLVNLWGFQFKDKNVWKDGHIYDPKNGKTYSCNMKLTNVNTLEVRGFIGVSLIGRTDTWTRHN